MQSVKRRLVLSLALVLGGCGPSEGRQKPARRQELIPAPEPPSDAVPRTELQRAEKSVLCNGSHAEHRLGVGWGFEAWEKLAVPFEHRHRVHSNLTRFDAPIDGVKSSADQPEVLGQDRPFDRRVVAFFLWSISATEKLFAIVRRVRILSIFLKVVSFVDPSNVSFVSVLR